jgi:UDP-N-acetylglucosamine:LPS N-acetylglucosamine transferase
MRPSVKQGSASATDARMETLTAFQHGRYTFCRMRKHIDFYTIDIGGGHIAPAMAIKEQFDLLGYNDVEVHVINLGLALGANFLRYIYRFYWNSALRYPPLINAFYRGADNPFMIKIIDRILGITILPRFVQFLEREKPDLVVSTYFTFTHYIELLKRVGQMDAVTVVLNPEPFDSHYIWFSPAFDWSLVFSRKSLEEIAEKGIPAGRLRQFQFPVKPSFSRRKESKTTLRRRLQIETKPFTALFFFGAEGVGPVKKYIALLIERRISLQAVVVCGRNERLQRDLETLAAGNTGTVHIAVCGYVNNLADYIAASDVVVGKSGPNQVFETLVQGRPLIISSFLANEKETTNWVIGNKVGWLTRTPSQLATRLAKLADQPDIISEYQRNINKLKLHAGAEEICEFLYSLVKNRKPKKKVTMGEALRKFRDAVVEGGEAITRRIDESEGMKRLREMASTRLEIRLVQRKPAAKAVRTGTSKAGNGRAAKAARNRQPKAGNGHAAKAARNRQPKAVTNRRQPGPVNGRPESRPSSGTRRP